MGYLADNYNYIMGKTSMCLTDFDLRPPEKFMGLIIQNILIIRNLSVKIIGLYILTFKNQIK